MSSFPTFVSLYSGCGGMDAGFIQDGFSCLNAFDFDKAAVDVHAANFKSPINLFDLSCPNESLIKSVAQSDVLIAGPPCQGFSTAGKNNPHDERNKHLNNVSKIAHLARPKIVLIENVKGLLSSANRVNFDETIDTLRDAGYQVTWDLHNVADYGVAQNRKRVLIFAVQSSDPIELAPICQPRKTLREAIASIPPDKLGGYKSVDIGTPEYEIVNSIKPGQKLSNVRSGDNYIHTWQIPRIFGEVSKLEISLLETLVKLRRQKRRRTFGDADPVDKVLVSQIFGRDSNNLISSLISKGYLRDYDKYIDISNTFNGKYRRLVWDEAAPTVDTRFGQFRYFLHPDENRGFSVREAARIQSFSDDFIFLGSDSSKYRMIGNAVPPKFAHAVAGSIKQVLKNI